MSSSDAGVLSASKSRLENTSGNAIHSSPTLNLEGVLSLSQWVWSNSDSSSTSDSNISDDDDDSDDDMLDDVDVVIVTMV